MRRGGLCAALVALACWSPFELAAQEPAEPAAEAPEEATEETAEPTAAVERPWFEYRLTQRVTNGTGEYAGWSDELTADGHYELMPSQVWARYDWRYHSRDDDRRGSENRRVGFDPATRQYTDRRIDLDDYDERPNVGLSIWWYVDPTLPVGAPVEILDETFTVVGPVAASDRTRGHEAILVELRDGVGRREDAYGSYATTYTDRYWFDANTGLFLREERTEHDVGTLDGSYATFDVRETVEVTAASYLEGTEPTWTDAGRRPDARLPTGARSDDLAPYRGGREADDDGERGVKRWWVYAGVAVAALIAFVLFRRYRQRAKTDFEGSVRDLRPADPLPPDVSSPSPTFAPLIPHLIRHTLASGQRVAIAKSSLGTAGVALGAPAGEAATIFAADTAACEALRQAIGATHFFSEVRHGHAFAALAAASQHSTALAGNHAYNVLETHEVLALAPVPSDVTYDAGLIKRADLRHLPAIIELADQVYGTGCKAWIEAAHATGDVILVATEDTKVIGFAIVSVAGSVARFHGLTVAADRRGKGVGKELNRARVRIAHDLAAERVLVEVASWNVASLEIARAVGFTKVGQMFVETASEVPTERKFQRR